MLLSILRLQRKFNFLHGEAVHSLRQFYHFIWLYRRCLIDLSIFHIFFFSFFLFFCSLNLCHLPQFIYLYKLGMASSMRSVDMVLLLSNWFTQAVDANRWFVRHVFRSIVSFVKKESEKKKIKRKIQKDFFFCVRRWLMSELIFIFIMYLSTLLLVAVCSLFCSVRSSFAQ